METESDWNTNATALETLVQAIERALKDVPVYSDEAPDDYVEYEEGEAPDLPPSPAEQIANAISALIDEKLAAQG